MPSYLGKYYDQVKLGSVFVGSTVAAGTAFPISTGTAVTFGLWNTNPKKNAVLLGLNVGYTSGTIALGQIGLAYAKVGYEVATGSPITAFTNATPVNALVGAGNASTMRFANSTATLAASQAAAWWWSGYSIESATAGLGIFKANFDLDGALILTPGHIAFLCGSVAQTALFSASMIWAEVDR